MPNLFFKNIKSAENFPLQVKAGRKIQNEIIECVGVLKGSMYGWQGTANEVDHWILQCLAKSQDSAPHTDKSFECQWPITLWTLIWDNVGGYVNTREAH